MYEVTHIISFAISFLRDGFRVQKQSIHRQLDLYANNEASGAQAERNVK